MYAACILFLSLALLTLGGWLDETFENRRGKILTVVGAILGAALCFVGEFRDDTVRCYPVQAIFCLLMLMTMTVRHPVGVLLASVLGGLIGWKLNEVAPLFFEPGVLAAVPYVVCALVYCRMHSERVLAVTLAPFVSSLCVSVSDYSLFRYCTIQLGSPDGMVASLSALLALLGLHVVSLGKLGTRIRSVIQERGNRRRDRNRKDQPDAAGYARDQLTDDVVVAEHALPIPIVVGDQQKVHQRAARKGKDQRIRHGANGVTADVHTGTEQVAEA